MFGLLEYRNSWNLGDNIQSLAAEAFLPRVDVLVDRDTSQLSQNVNQPVNIIFNGWFDGNYLKFPLPPILRPFFESVHINETIKDASYKSLTKFEIPFTPMASHKFWKYETIRCRDPHTVAQFAQYGIQAKFGGCMTLTLQKTVHDKTDDIYIVDVPKECLHMIPPADLKRGIILKHAILKQMPHCEKMELARGLLLKYQTAKRVYTGRLHCLLPCKAFRTDVIFLPSNPHDPRFLGLADLTHEQVTILADGIRTRVQQWIQRCSRPHGVSILTGCKNRLLHLKESLPTWVALHPKEIVIVDWSSSDQDEVQKLVDSYNSSKTKIILLRVSESSSWSISFAINFGANFTSGKRLLKLDCDSKVHPDFLRYHSLTGKVFFAGNWRLARNENERHTNGICFMKRKHFIACGGMNEYLGSWYGYDDCKLYRDLELLSLTRANFQPDFFTHIEHNTSSRSTHPIPLPVQIERNRIISETYGKPKEHSTLKWLHSNFYEYISSMVLNESIQQDCLLKAVKNISQKKKFLILEVKNGIGNRMRSLASAYPIAKASNRQLVLVWVSDMHCMAKFEDLFERTGPMEHVTVLDFLPNLNRCAKIFGPVDSTMDQYDYSQRKDEIIRDDTQHDIFVSSACCLKSPHSTWAKQNEFLQSLVIHKSIRDEIKKFGDVSKCIGVHVRMSQPELPCEDVSKYGEQTRLSTEKWRNASHWSHFAIEMRKTDSIYFVCCDNKEALDSLKREFGNQVISFPEKLYDRSTRQIQLALIDCLLLSQCSKIIGSPFSSFSELAHRFSKTKMQLISEC